MKLIIRCLGGVLALAVLGSCNASHDAAGVPPPPTPTTAPSTAPVPGSPRSGVRSHRVPGDEHWVQNEQLRAVMLRISDKTQKYWPQEIPGQRDDQRAGDLEQAAESARRLAAGLATSADRIPAAVEHVEMTDTDRAGFVAEAATLRRQALDLGEAAAARKPAEMQQHLDAITATCVSCHTRYRDLAGALDVQRVSNERTAPVRPARQLAGTPLP